MKKPTKLLLAEHAIVTYYHEADVGSSPEDLLKPAYWSHVASKLRMGHKIEVLAQDASFWATLIVLDTGRNEAQVAPLLVVKLEADDLEVEDETMFIKYRGPHARYGVLRKEDNEVLRDGFQSKAAAAEWMKNRMVAA